MSMVMSQRMSLLAGCVAFFVLIVISVMGSTHYVYDEIYYVEETTTLLRNTGLNETFLNDYPYPAGLANCILLGQLDQSVGITPLIARLCNLVLLGIVIVACALLLKSIGQRDPCGGGMVALTNPVVWVMAGLALTEMLAVAATILAVVMLWGFSKQQGWPIWRAVAGGLLFGVAVLSRPQLLVIVPPLVLLTALTPGTRPKSTLVAFGISSVAVFGPVFAFWHGIVPPAVARWNFEYGTLSFKNMVLASGYAGLMMLLLAPNWYRIDGRRLKTLIAVTAAALFVVNLATSTLEIETLQSAAKKVLPPAIHEYYPRLCGGVLLAMAGVFHLITIIRVIELRTSPLLFVSALAMIFIVFSTTKITHQFSSRYVAVAFPFMVLAASPYRGPAGWEVVRLLIGGLLGANSLLSYFGSKA